MFCEIEAAALSFVKFETSNYVFIRISITNWRGFVHGGLTFTGQKVKTDNCRRMRSGGRVVYCGDESDKVVRGPPFLRCKSMTHEIL